MASNMSLCFAQEDSNYQTCPAANTYSEDALNFTEFYPCVEVFVAAENYQLVSVSSNVLWMIHALPQKLRNGVGR